MSGGPVCVQSTNSLSASFFIPAGVCLGGSGNSIARVIDVDVVDLINRAEVSGTIGTNHTGGGVVLINVANGRDASKISKLEVHFGPPAAIALGAMWRVSPTNFGDLSYYTNFVNIPLILPVRNANFLIEATDVPGFIRPVKHTITISEEATVVYDLMYTLPPSLTFNAVNGLGITGTAGTTYRIESAAELGLSNAWTAVVTVTLNAATNWISNTAPAGPSNRFYRAVWLPE